MDDDSDLQDPLRRPAMSAVVDEPFVKAAVGVQR